MPFFSITGNHGVDWIEANIDLPENTTKIQFIGTRGSSSDSDIALDNILMSVLTCPGKLANAIIDIDISAKHCLFMFILS